MEAVPASSAKAEEAKSRGAAKDRDNKSGGKEGKGGGKGGCKVADVHFLSVSANGFESTISRVSFIRCSNVGMLPSNSSGASPACKIGTPRGRRQEEGA